MNCSVCEQPMEPDGESSPTYAICSPCLDKILNPFAINMIEIRQFFDGFIQQTFESGRAIGEATAVFQELDY